MRHSRFSFPDFCDMLDVNLIFSRPGFSLSAAFTLHAGGITVLRGDSGSGKTTLADLLSGASEQLWLAH